jgi:hypothetical protein
VSRHTLLPLALLLAPSLAHAETSVDVNVAVDVHEDGGAPPCPPPSGNALGGHRWEGELSFDASPMGGFHADGLDGGSGGVGVTLARQLGPLRLGLEYGFSKFSAQRDLYTADGWWDGWEDVGGEMQRYGAIVRLRAASSLDAPFSPTGGAYVELGVGREQLRYDGGGARSRDDLAAGLGLEGVMVGHRHMGGMDFGVRFLATDAPDGTHDVAVLMHLGALFGL